MEPKLINFKNDNDFREFLAKINVDNFGIDILANKSRIYYILIKNVNCTCANIIKQSMISAGGDAAVHKNVINHKVEKSDVLLFGTKKVFRIFIESIKYQPFKFKDLSEKINKILFEKGDNNIILNNGKILDFNNKTYLMGILNVTPDSFSDGGKYLNIDDALRHAEILIKDGADIIDVGGESSRPGSKRIDKDEELKRVIPVIKKIRNEFKDIIISIDTYKSEVAEEAINVGADIINDISSGDLDENNLRIASKYNVPIVLMHMKGTPENMQDNPVYEDVLEEIYLYLEEKINLCYNKYNFKKQKIIIDPGIGFGKNLHDNLFILKNLDYFKTLKAPLLLGASRKRFINDILDVPVNERLEGSLAAVAWGMINDVNIFRVHDVKETLKFIKVFEYIKKS